MNKDLMDLEQHEGEKLMTEFSFWVNYPFKVRGVSFLEHALRGSPITMHWAS